MRNAILVSILTVVLVVGAAAVYAGPPIAGTYKSTDDDFDEGTATTGWIVPGYFSAGNVIFARSHDGVAFTNDWQINCATVQNAVLLVPKFGANGQEIWQITYAPGSGVQLGGPGNPWNGGDATYVGIIDYYTEIRTVQYISNAVVGAVSDHSLGAHIQGYPESCALWGIGNGVLRGGTPGGTPAFTYPTLQSVKSLGYPGFPAPGCFFSENGSGHWDDIRDLTLSITGCAVATQQSTWGNVKAMYRK
jgi:hypothetical protein